jgi:Protein of unknown function (DUF3551)
MRHALIGIAALAAASVAGLAPASAQHWQGRGTWCTQPPMGNGSPWSCYYYSRAQCMLTAGYGPSSCVPNPAAEWERRGFKIPDDAKPRKPTRAQERELRDLR